MVTLLALCVIGAFTGFLAGLLGVGGGMMLVPFMTFLFALAKFPQDLVIKMALATSLTTILFTSISSVRAHHKKGMVRWDIAPAMGIGAMIGTFIGANLAGRLPAQWLATFFAVFVSYAAIQMLRDKKPQPSREVPAKPVLGSVGFGVGFISSLVGAGGAFISTPFMVWCNVVMHQAIGTSAALGFPIAVGGLIGYVIAGMGVEGLPDYSLGFVYLPALLATALASMTTAPFGARTAHKMQVASLKKAFALLLLVLSSYMLIKAFQ